MRGGRVIVMAVAVAGAATGAAVFAPGPTPPIGPRVRFPADINLGERRRGEIAAAEFPLTNVGDRPLHVTEIRATCSCAGLEADEDGRRVRVTELSIPPGATAALAFRVSVSVPPGQPQTVQIMFRTNDPTVPQVGVTATVTRVVGVPFLRPSGVNVGVVRVGRPVSEVVDVLPNAVAGVRVTRVISSNPDLVSATLETPEAGADEPGGRPVGRVRVTALATRPTDLDAVVTVGVAGEGLPPQAEVLVRVAGRVRHAVECRPAEVTFRGDDPQTVYLVGADAGLFQATVVGTPPGLTAVVTPEPPLAGRVQARLVLTPVPYARPSGAVRLAVMVGTAPPFDLEVPVSCPAP